MRVEALQPRPECPEPGRWAAPDDWATETDVSRFVGDLVRVLKPDYCVETGSYQGHTSQQIGLALREQGRGYLVSLERNADRAAEARTRCAGLPVSVVAGMSLDYATETPIDFIFCDSDFPIRIKELVHFQKWASPRCVIALHDPSVPAKYPGMDIMLRDMDEVVQAGILQPWLTLPTPRGLALTRYRV